MLNPSAPVETDDDVLSKAVADCSTDAGLAPFLAAAGGILVLDDTIERVLRASTLAAALRDAISQADGRVLPGLRERIRRAGLPRIGTRLVRIRFDRRGIARPTACLIARVGRMDGVSETPVLLLAPVEPIPTSRPLAARASAPALPVASPSDPPLSEQPLSGEGPSSPTGRFVWNSDGDDVVTRVAGLPSEVEAALSGRRWRTLREHGLVRGDMLLAALAQGRTFRALPLSVRPAGGAHVFELDVSGAPSARPGRPFAGFSGFGLLRERRPRGQDDTGSSPGGRGAGSDEQDLAPAPIPGDAAPEASGAGRTMNAPVNTPMNAPAAPIRDVDTSRTEAPPEEPSPPSAPAATAAATVLDATMPPGAEPLAPGGAPGAASAAPSTSEAPRSAALSTNEHAAFREIARALGARFAGDDETPRLAEAAENGGRRGAVMAFPAGAASGQNAAIETAIVAALDRLPAGVLVHREGIVAFANRRVLELTGFADRAAMQAAGGLAPLFRGRRSDDTLRSDDEPVSVTTGNGGLTGLLIERSRVDWEGRPAELLLVRPANAVEPMRELAAQALLQVREATREHEARALLDQIEEGVATLDADGRVLGVNRSAAALLSGDAREIVGATLADQFSTANAPTIAACLRQAQGTGAGEPCLVEARAGERADGAAGHGALRLRIVRLPTMDGARFCATIRPMPAPMPVPEAVEPGRPQRSVIETARVADFLAKVDHEIRTPLNGILGLVDAMLSEQLGPIGSERHRVSLRDIHGSGERVLRFVDDLLDLARIEAGQVELSFTDLALNDVVSACIAQMQAQAARDRIVFRTSLSPDLAPLKADERSMRQAALNVIANAIRFTEAGGQVIVSTTTAERGEIAFRVRDTGVGMTEEEIADALEPFRHVGTAASYAAHGSGNPAGGLGLTLTKALVEANRGQFRISSRKNEGTLVEMVFPAPQVRSA